MYKVTSGQVTWSGRESLSNTSTLPKYDRLVPKVNMEVMEPRVPYKSHATNVPSAAVPSRSPFLVAHTLSDPLDAGMGQEQFRSNISGQWTARKGVQCTQTAGNAVIHRPFIDFLLCSIPFLCFPVFPIHHYTI